MTFVAAVCCMMLGFVSTVNAEDLADKAVIRICGKQVTADNKADVTSPGISAGKVSYDDVTHTLTLDGVTMGSGGPDPAIYIEADQIGADFTIKYKGAGNYVSGTDAIPLHFAKAAAGKGLIIMAAEESDDIKFWTYSSGSFEKGAIVCREDYSKTDEATYFPLTVTGGGKVVADNSFADGKAAITCHHLNLKGAGMVIYSSDYAGPYDDVYYTKANVFERVMVKSESTHKIEYDYYNVDYPVWVAGIRLNDKNKSVSYPKISSGTVSYDADNRVVTLSSAKVSYGDADAAIIINDEVNPTSPITINLDEGTGSQVEGTKTANALYCKTPVILKTGYWKATFNATATAIRHNAELTIMGGGNLAASASGSGSYGIQGEGSGAKLIINASNVTVNGKEACVSEPAHELKGVKISDPATATWADADPSPKDGSDVVKDKNLKFTQSEFTLSAINKPADAGTVKIEKEVDTDVWEEISNPYVHDGTYISVRLTAMPKEGYAFGYWGTSTTDNDPVKTTSISNSDEEYVANYRYDMKTTTKFYTAEYMTKDIYALPDGLNGTTTKIATLDANESYVSAAGFYDGKIMYTDYDGSMALIIYSADFTPDETTKLGAKTEVVPATNAFNSPRSMVYSEAGSCWYFIAYNNSTSKTNLCKINGDKIEVAMTANLEEVRAIAADAAGELYGVMADGSKYYFVHLNIASNGIEKVGALDFSWVSNAAMTYDPALGRFVFYYDNAGSMFYLINPANGEAAWVSSMYINEPAGMFAYVSPAPKHKITIKVAEGQESRGSVSPSGDKNLPEGAKLTIEAKANKGYMFDKWSDEGAAKHEITVGTEDATYTAYFKEDPDMKIYPIQVAGQSELYTGHLSLTHSEITEISTGAITFDATKNTLTLNSLTLTTSSDVIALALGNADAKGQILTVVVTGDCKINTGSAAGIVIKGYKKVVFKAEGTGAKLTIKGNGGIELDGSDVEISGLMVDIQATGSGIKGTNDESLSVIGSPIEVTGSGVGSIHGLNSLDLKYVELPSGMEFEDNAVKKSGSVVKSKITFKSYPKLTCKPMIEGTGTFRMEVVEGEGDNQEGLEAYFKTGTKVKIIAVPENNFTFIRWKDNTNWKDEEKYWAADGHPEITISGDATYEAMFFYEPKSTADWYGIKTADPNKGFAQFSLSDYGTKFEYATSPSTGSVQCGDFVQGEWYYKDGNNLKSVEFSGAFTSDHKIDATPNKIGSSSTTMKDMAYDLKGQKVYAIDGAKLYELDGEKFEEVGSFQDKDKNPVTAVAIAIDASGTIYILAKGATEGILYTVDGTDEKKVNLAIVGDDENGGKIGRAVTTDQQSIAFDHVTGELFWGADDYMRIIQMDDMKTYPVADLGQTEGKQGFIKSLHRMDKTVKIYVQVYEKHDKFGKVTINGKEDGANVIVGLKAKLVATPNSGYHFEKWMREGDDEFVEKTATYEFTVKKKGTYIAYFGEGEGIEDVQVDDVQCTKVLIDGALYIIRDGKVYNANGLRVK
jgi:hypothetical protein